MIRLTRTLGIEIFGDKGKTQNKEQKPDRQ